MGRLENCVIVVLGMHRSGTSAFTGSLARLGVDVGASLLVEQADNETGFWEHREVVEAHDRLLQKFSSSWDDTAPLPERWWDTPEAQAAAEELKQFLLRDFSGSKLWTIKDPRMCRLLPLWKPLLKDLGCDVRYVMVVRHPAETARSLFKRNGTIREVALQLWLEHHLDAEFETRGEKRVLLRFDDLLKDPVATFAKVASGLDLEWPRSWAEVGEQVLGFLNVDQKHHSAKTEPELPQLVVRSFEALCDGIAGQEAKMREQLDAVGREFSSMLSWFAPVVRNRGANLQSHIDELHAMYTWQIGGLQGQVRTLEKERLNVLKRLDQREKKLAHAESKLSDTNDRLDTIRKSWAWTLSKPVRALEKALGRDEPKAGSALSASKPKEIRKPAPATKKEKPATAPATAPVTGDIKSWVAATNRSALLGFLQSDAKLRLPKHTQPDVSILLILFNRAELTYACLRSLASIQGRSYEVVIVDNASSDETPLLLDRIENATIIRNAENKHFLEGTNQASAAAKGKALLFLNNDAQLLPNAVENAWDTLYSDASIGAVGGKIILPDGTLQEAGSIVWADGSCLGYGRGADPSAPEFQCRRDVDFCSGAFLMNRKSDFDALSGFDTRYAPAYYEETDFCMRLWEAGKRVVYEPRSAILHFEFASSSKPEEAIELQKRNRQAFVERHAAALRQHLPPSASSLLLARRHHGSQERRVLVIEDRVPHTHLGSGYPRSNKLVQKLAELGCAVTLYPIQSRQTEWPQVYDDTPPSVEVMIGLKVGGLQQFLADRKDFYDDIIVSRPHNMRRFVELFPKRELLGRSRIIYDAEAVFAAREWERRRILGEPVDEATKQRELAEELAPTEYADVVVTVSERERALTASASKARCVVLSHLAPALPNPNPFTARTGLLFVGAIYQEESPNADSVLWFEKEVFPKIREKSDLKVSIVGHNEVASIRLLDRPEFRVHGAVPELVPFYRTARVFIAPTRYSAGIPLKAYEAASFGIPIVATSLLASQLGWKDGQELLVADTAEDFAAQCIRLHEDASLWDKIRKNALAAVERDCSDERFTADVRSILAR